MQHQKGCIQDIHCNRSNVLSTIYVCKKLDVRTVYADGGVCLYFTGVRVPRSGEVLLPGWDQCGDKMYPRGEHCHRAGSGGCPRGEIPTGHAHVDGQ